MRNGKEVERPEGGPLLFQVGWWLGKVPAPSLAPYEPASST